MFSGFERRGVALTSYFSEFRWILRSILPHNVFPILLRHLCHAEVDHLSYLYYSINWHDISRIYAVTLGNRVLVVYFGALAVARLIMGILTAFLNSPGVAANTQFKMIPNSIGTTLGMFLMCPRWQNLRIRTERDPRGELSAFLVILWHTYQNKRTLGFSAILHRLVASSTVYFLVMVAAQISVQVSVNLIQVHFPTVPSLLRDDSWSSKGQQLSLLWVI